MLAGAATVLFSPTQITIIGGAGADSVRISTVGGPGTQFTVTGLAGTVLTTKGTAPLSSASVNILASMGAGSDYVMLSQATVKNVTFVGGAGANTFYAGSVDIRGSTIISMGTGTATGANLAILGVGTYQGAVTITGGNYADQVGLGQDSMFSGTAVFNGRVVVNTLGGADWLLTGSIPATFNSAVAVSMGVGNDFISLGFGSNAVTFNGSTTLDLGAGNDSVNFDANKAGSTVTFNGAINRIALGTGDDFTSVSGGWRTGCLAFGANTSNTITGGLGIKSSDLRLGLLQSIINASVKMISFSF
jgi:hypothetical protein